MILKIKKIEETAKIPEKAYEYDAGLDLFSGESVTIAPKTRTLIKTNIAMAIPKGYYGQIFDRSGNAYKKGLHVLAGVIDSSYRGNVGVVLYNTSDETVFIDSLDKIAQMVILPVPEIELVEILELDDSSRGENGFGSTGN